MSLLMEALRKAEEAKRSARNSSGIDPGTETTGPESEETVSADRGQSDSARISATYPTLDTEDNATDTESPADQTTTSQDQQSANAVFLAKQITRRRQQQRRHMTVLLALLVLLPAAGGLYYFWQTRLAGPDGITTPASLADRPAGTYLDTATPAADNPTDAVTDNAPAAPTSSPDDDRLSGDSAGSDATISDSSETNAQEPPDTEGSTEDSGTDNDNTAMPEEAVAETASTGVDLQPPGDSPEQPLQLSRRDSTLVVTPELSAAYEHFLSGNLAAATADYRQALEDDPRNREAMLGLATIYRRQGDTPSAQRLYARLLELNPRDPLARTGLIEAARSADPVQRESDLKQLLEEFPALAPVSFALGNLHASQGRWREAQNAYFNALRKARDSEGGPISPDYAFNLAISLERLGEPDLALEYYLEAEALAQELAPGFDLKVLHQRLQALQ